QGSVSHDDLPGAPARRREVPGPTGRPPFGHRRYLARRTGGIPENSRKKPCRVAAATGSADRRTTTRIGVLTISYIVGRGGRRDPGIAPSGTSRLRCSLTFHGGRCPVRGRSLPGGRCLVRGRCPVGGRSRVRGRSLVGGRGLDRTRAARCRGG